MSEGVCWRWKTRRVLSLNHKAHTTTTGKGGQARHKTKQKHSKSSGGCQVLGAWRLFPPPSPTTIIIIRPPQPQPSALPHHLPLLELTPSFPFPSQPFSNRRLQPCKKHQLHSPTVNSQWSTPTTCVSCSSKSTPSFNKASSTPRSFWEGSSYAEPALHPPPPPPLQKCTPFPWNSTQTPWSARKKSVGPCPATNKPKPIGSSLLPHPPPPLLPITAPRPCPRPLSLPLSPPPRSKKPVAISRSTILRKPCVRSSPSLLLSARVPWSCK